VCVVGVGAVAVQIITAEPDVAIQSLDPAQGDDFLMCVLFTFITMKSIHWLAGWLAGWLTHHPLCIIHCLSVPYVSPS
jgi:hypothetical protein